MICKTCGSLLDGNSSVCDLCGTPIEKPDVQEAQPKTDIWPWDAQKDDAKIAETTEIKPTEEKYADLFKAPIDASEEEKRRKFDFSWDSQEFHTADYKKRDTVELRWDAGAVEEMRNAPLNPFAASIGEAVRENEAAEADKKRTEDSRNVFEDDIFDLRQSESEESKLRFSKKNEEFQELLDQEVEKIQRRQKEIDEARNRLESEDVMTAPVATPSVLTAGEKIKSVDERIAEFIARTDQEMLEAMRKRLNENKGKQDAVVEVEAEIPAFAGMTEDTGITEDVVTTEVPEVVEVPEVIDSVGDTAVSEDMFTLDDVDADVVPVDADATDFDTKKILPAEIEVDPTWFEVTTSDDAEIKEIPALIDEVVGPTWYEVTTTVDEDEIAGQARNDAADSILPQETPASVIPASEPESIDALGTGDIGATDAIDAPDVVPAADSILPQETPAGVIPASEPESIDTIGTGDIGATDTIASPIVVSAADAILASDVIAAEAGISDDSSIESSAFFVTGWASPFDVDAGDDSEASEAIEISKDHSLGEAPSDIPDFIYGDLPEKDPLPDYKPINNDVKAPAFFDEPIDFPFDEGDEIGGQFRNDAEDAITAEAADVPDTRVAGPGFVDFGASIFSGDDAKDEIAGQARNDAVASIDAADLDSATDVISAEVGISDGAAETGISAEVGISDDAAETGNTEAASDDGVSEILKPYLDDPKSSGSDKTKPDKAKPETKVWLRNLINILVVIAVLFIAFFAVMKFVPDSGVGMLFNEIWTSVFNGDSSADDSDDAGDDALVPDVVDNSVSPIADKEALVASQLFYNTSIKEIVYDSEARREQGATYELAGANSAAEITNDFWQKGTIGPVLFDEEAVAGVIRYNSDLIKSTKGTSADILNDVTLGSPEEAKLPDYLADIGVLTIDRLGIGEILTDGVYYYVWTSVEGVETIGGKDKKFTEKEVYQLSLDVNVMKVYDHVTIK